MDTHLHIAHKNNQSSRRIAALRVLMLTAPPLTHQSYWSPGASDLLLRLAGDEPPAPADGAAPHVERLSRALERLLISGETPAHPAHH